MKRRDALKMIAASVPVFATIGCSTMMEQQTTVSSGMKTLNLVFEGPFVIDLNGPQAQVFAPAVGGHVYLIDGKTAAPGNYSIAGIGGARDLMNTRFDLPRGADAFRLSASQLHLSLNTEKVPFFKFSLPVPDRIVALSSREAQVVDAYGNTRPALMPTSYVFVYHVTSARELALSPNLGWQPQASASQAGAGQAGYANLVVAAGLPLDIQDPMGHHAAAAFAEVTSYLPGLNMQILSTGAELRTGDVEGLPEALRNRNLPQARNAERPARLVNTVLTNRTRNPRLLTVSHIIDCQAGGVVVTTP